MEDSVSDQGVEERPQSSSLPPRGLAQYGTCRISFGSASRSNGSISRASTASRISLDAIAMFFGLKRSLKLVRLDPLELKARAPAYHSPAVW